jgi:hypothetical protein
VRGPGHHQRFSPLTVKGSVDGNAAGNSNGDVDSELLDRHQPRAAAIQGDLMDVRLTRG